jgi:hypothetical protein
MKLTNRTGLQTKKAATVLTIGEPQCSNSKPLDDKKSLGGKQVLSEGSVLRPIDSH